MNCLDANLKVSRLIQNRGTTSENKLKVQNTKSILELVKIAQNHGNVNNLFNMHINDL
jgi:hypothetical protein